MEASRRFVWFEQILLLLGAGLAVLLRVGASPLLWLDTLNDLRLVNLCLDHGHCLTSGAPVSFGHFVQGAAWHQLLAFFSWLGLGLEGMHLVMVVFDALAVVLVAVAAARVAGRLAGLFAALAFVLLLDSMDPLSQMVWNFRLLPFFGAAVLGLCVWLADKQKVSMAALAAALSAMAANMHLVSGALFLSLVLVCATLTGKRVKMLAAAAGVFLTVLLISSPAAWWQNLQALLAGHSAPLGNLRGSLDALSWVVLAGVVVSAGLLFIHRRTREAARRQLLALLAMILPLLLVYMLAQLLLNINRTDRYLAPAIPATAAGIGVLLGWAAVWLQRRFIDSEQVNAWIHKATVPVAVALLCLIPGPRPRPAGFPEPTVAETGKALAFLQKKPDWGSPAVFAGLKSPVDYLMLEYAQVAKLFRPGPGAESLPSTALVLTVPVEQLPEQTPDELLVISKSSRQAILVLVSPSFMDWSSFRVCSSDEPDRAPRNCPETGLNSLAAGSLRPVFAIRHMPDAGQRLGRELILRVRARIPAGRRIHELWMPRTRDLCGGRILSVPGQASQISMDGRHARLVADPIGDQTGEVVLAWKIGGPDCPLDTYKGFPPFFLEAEPQSMKQLRPLFAPYERRGS